MSLSLAHRKATQALNFLARQSPGGRINKLKALKLVFFADRYHLKVAPIGADSRYVGASPLIDTLGGGPGVDTYEKLIHYDANGLAKTLR